MDDDNIIERDKEKNVQVDNVQTDIHLRPGFHANEPYPEVKVSAPNSYYAKLIMNDFAGIISEFSAITQYLYHNFSLKKEHKDLAKVIENISMVEMHHMEILSEVLVQLGVEPYFKNSSNKFWDANYIYYGRNVCDKLKADLKSEYAAIETYELHISLIKDVNIQNVLKRIVMDEKVHAKIFEEQIKKYCSK